MAMRIDEVRAGDLGRVWIIRNHPEAALVVEKALQAEFDGDGGAEPPSPEGPTSIVFCPNGEDVAAGIAHLRTLAPEAPVLVFGASPDPWLATAALRAGASGFLHAGMQPAHVVRALSLVRQGEIVIPRDIVADLLGEDLFLRLPTVLGPFRPDPRTSP